MGMVTALQHMPAKPTLWVAAKAANTKLKCILNTNMKSLKDSHKRSSILNSKIIIIIQNYFKLNINSVHLVICHLNKLLSNRINIISVQKVPSERLQKLDFS